MDPLPMAELADVLDQVNVGMNLMQSMDSHKVHDHGFASLILMAVMAVHLDSPGSRTAGEESEAVRRILL
jgi:hypothetical protein